MSPYIISYPLMHRRKFNIKIQISIFHKRRIPYWDCFLLTWSNTNWDSSKESYLCRTECFISWQRIWGSRRTDALFWHLLGLGGAARGLGACREVAAAQGRAGPCWRSHVGIQRRFVSLDGWGWDTPAELQAWGASRARAADLLDHACCLCSDCSAFQGLGMQGRCGWGEVCRDSGLLHCPCRCEDYEK